MSTRLGTDSSRTGITSEVEHANRRSACDRCRGQKLRCERDDGAHKCRRCTRARAECNTSEALRSGRPPHLFGTKRRRLSTERNEHHGDDSADGLLLDSPNLPTPPSESIAVESRYAPGSGPAAAEKNSRHEAFYQDSVGGSFQVDDFWLTGFLQSSAISELQQSTTTLTTNSIDAVPTPSNSCESTQSRAECLRKLALLHSEVLTDLTTIKAVKTIDKCQPDTCSQSVGSGNFLIGRMLTHSENFLDILKNFAPKKPAHRSQTDTDDAQNDAIERVSNNATTCDVPTTFSVLSCYVCIVRIYRTNLACIYDSLVLAQKMSLTVPPIFPGLHLGGFQLENYPMFHIHMLVEMSQILLSKIDSVLGFGNDPESQAHAVLDTSFASSVLKTMLKEEAAERPSAEGHSSHLPVTEIIDKLKILTKCA